MMQKFVLLLLFAVALLVSACSDSSDSGTELVAPTSVAPATDSQSQDSDAVQDGSELADEVPSTTSNSASGPFAMQTSDGVTLAGDFVGSGPTGVVLAHMRGASRETWAEFAGVLADNGYRVLYFDFRGYGESEGERDTNLDIDLAAAIRTLNDDGIEDVFVFGASMGGTAAIVSAAEHGLAGVVSLSGPAEFLGLDALGSSAALDEPVLFLATESDSPYAAHASQMAEAAGTEPVILSGGSHGTNMFAEHGEVLEQMLIEFIDANSGESTN